MRISLILNLLIPGAGLILRGRDWLGLSVALLFGASGNVALSGWLIAPASFPWWMRWSASALAIATWVLGQWLLHRRSNGASTTPGASSDLPAATS